MPSGSIIDRVARMNERPPVKRRVDILDTIHILCGPRLQPTALTRV
jgi:hypothetical protein